VIGDIIHGRWSNIWNDAKTVASSIAGAVGKAVGAIPGIIKGLLKKIGSAAVSIGGAILSGIETGLGDLGSWLWDKIKSMIEGSDRLGRRRTRAERRPHAARAEASQAATRRRRRTRTLAAVSPERNRRSAYVRDRSRPAFAYALGAVRGL
jgi:hypothetical protein